MYTYNIPGECGIQNSRRGEEKRRETEGEK
jgi:hypothetical protein